MYKTLITRDVEILDTYDTDKGIQSLVFIPPRLAYETFTS